MPETVEQQRDRLAILVEQAAAALEWEWYGPAPGREDPCPLDMAVDDWSRPGDDWPGGVA